MVGEKVGATLGLRVGRGVGDTVGLGVGAVLMQARGSDVHRTVRASATTGHQAHECSMSHRWWVSTSSLPTRTLDDPVGGDKQLT